MTEATLKDFFTGVISGKELNAQAETIIHQVSSDTTEHRVAPMSESFVVTRRHLLKLCESTLDGSLSIENLSALCLILELSEQLEWCDNEKDAEILADVANWCASPEINYPLTLDNLRLFAEYLQTGNDPFVK